jgi:hypothetical protein
MIRSNCRKRAPRARPAHLLITGERQEALNTTATAAVDNPEP